MGFFTVSLDICARACYNIVYNYYKNGKTKKYGVFKNYFHNFICNLHCRFNSYGRAFGLGVGWILLFRGTCLFRAYAFMQTNARNQRTASATGTERRIKRIIRHGKNPYGRKSTNDKIRRSKKIISFVWLTNGKSCSIINV